MNKLQCSSMSFLVSVCVIVAGKSMLYFNLVSDLMLIKQEICKCAHCTSASQHFNDWLVMNTQTFYAPLVIWVKSCSQKLFQRCCAETILCLTGSITTQQHSHSISSYNKMEGYTLHTIQAPTSLSSPVKHGIVLLVTIHKGLDCISGSSKAVRHQEVHHKIV